MPMSILGESFKLHEVPFGTDLKNRKWKTINEPITGTTVLVTFFHLTGSGKQYVILIDSNRNIKFNTVEDFDDIETRLNNPEEIFKFTKYDRSQGNLNLILGSILSILKRSKLAFHEIKFHGNDEKLQKMYIFFANNPKIQHYLETIGVELIIEKNILCCKF